MKKEIHETLESLAGIQRAEPAPFLFERINQRLHKKEAKVVWLSPDKLWKAAACLAVLVSLNVLVWTRTMKAEKAQGAENPLAQEYFSYLNNTLQF